MQTIALVSQKGGVGKTTLSVHLAAKAASLGFRTLLIDLDPQANASKWGDRRGDRPPDVMVEHPTRLDQTLTSAAARGYEVAILDTAPHSDNFALRAARLSNEIIVPLVPYTFDLDALKSSLELCELAGKPTQVQINLAPIRSRVIEDATAEVKRLGGKLSPVVIHQRVAFRHCLIDGQVAGEWQPDGAADAEITALWKRVHPNTQVGERTNKRTTEHTNKRTIERTNKKTVERTKAVV